VQLLPSRRLDCERQSRSFLACQRTIAHGLEGMLEEPGRRNRAGVLSGFWAAPKPGSKPNQTDDNGDGAEC
jgi:hypothetical protein